MREALGKLLSLLIIVMLIAAGCNNKEQSKLSVMKSDFGKVDGRQVFLYTLKNKNGLTVKIMNYGAIITSVQMKNKNGEYGDIVLGFDSLQPYLSDKVPYFGAIVGRYANRIAKGEFTLDGKNYILARNNGNNALHGGITGLDKVVWNSSESADSSVAQVVMSYLSADGEEGYPGNLRIVVTYALNDNDELHTIIEATTDAATPVNLTNHTYFNLNSAKNDILGHILSINASAYTPVSDELIPTGEIRQVSGTPMDFTKPEVIGSRIAEVPGGYDHNYVLDHEPGSVSQAAVLEDPESGRFVGIYTDQPGIQFYSGNFLDGSITGKDGRIYKKHYGMCLETQHFPDSPNQPAFPNTILRPGEKFSATTIYKFGIRE